MSVPLGRFWAVWALGGPRKLFSKFGVSKMFGSGMPNTCFVLGGSWKAFLGCLLCGSRVDKLPETTSAHESPRNSIGLIVLWFVCRGRCLSRSRTKGSPRANIERREQIREATDFRRAAKYAKQMPQNMPLSGMCATLTPRTVSAPVLGAHFAQIRPTSGKAGQIWQRWSTAPHWTKDVQLWPALGQVRPTLAELGLALGQRGPELVELGPDVSKRARHLSSAVPLRPTLGQHVAKFGQTCPQSDLSIRLRKSRWGGIFGGRFCRLRRPPQVDCVRVFVSSTCSAPPLAGLCRHHDIAGQSWGVAPGAAEEGREFRSAVGGRSLAGRLGLRALRHGFRAASSAFSGDQEERQAKTGRQEVPPGMDTEMGELGKEVVTIRVHML